MKIFNTSHVLSKISLRLKNFIVKQELEQNFKKEKGGGKEGEEERRERKGVRRGKN